MPKQKQPTQHRASCQAAGGTRSAASGRLRAAAWSRIQTTFPCGERGGVARDASYLAAGETPFCWDIRTGALLASFKSAKWQMMQSGARKNNAAARRRGSVSLLRLCCWRASTRVAGRSQSFSTSTRWTMSAFSFPLIAKHLSLQAGDPEAPRRVRRQVHVNSGQGHKGLSQRHRTRLLCVFSARTRLAALMAGSESVMRCGGGFGESYMGCTHLSACHVVDGSRLSIEPRRRARRGIGSPRARACGLGEERVPREDAGDVPVWAEAKNDAVQLRQA